MFGKSKLFFALSSQYIFLKCLFVWTNNFIIFYRIKWFFLLTNKTKIYPKFFIFLFLSLILLKIKMLMYLKILFYNFLSNSYKINVFFK